MSARDPENWNPNDPYCPHRPLSDILAEWAGALSMLALLALAAWAGMSEEQRAHALQLLKGLLP